MTSRRSGNTCAECRARKVKCDGRKEICTPCERLRLHCSFERTRDALRPTPDPSAVTGRRAKAACKGCQNLKARCSGERPRCQRCVSRDIDCVYATSKRRSNVAQQHNTGQRPSITPDAAMSLPLSMSPLETGHPQTTLSPNEFAEVTAVDPLRNRTIILRVLEAFFQNIQPLPIYSYLHKASLIHRFQTGLLSPSLLLALIGITCDILDLGPSMREIGHACLTKAEDLVMKGIKVPSAVKIQALILIIEANVRQGQTSAAFMLFAIASRFAYALRLNHEAPRLCFLEQESRRRLMWSLYLIDTTLAGGIHEFSLCHSDTIYLQLPCQERNFELDIAQKTEPLKLRSGTSVSDNLGSLGICVRVRWIRYRILEVTKQAVRSSSEDLQKLPGRMEELVKDLDTVYESLPSDLQFTERNLQLRAYSARFAPFMLFHLWWRQCRCDLYRVVLTGLREALREEQILQLDPSIVSYYRMKCFESAKNMSNFLGRLPWLREKGVVLELDLLVCAYQCMRLLQQSFRHSDLEANLVNESLGTLVGQCVECIQALQATSPYSQRIKQDLMETVGRGSSRSATPEPYDAPTNSTGSTHSPVVHTPIFSRHSIIRDMRVEDDSSDLAGLSIPSWQPAQPSVPAMTDTQQLAPVSETEAVNPVSNDDSFSRFIMADLASFNPFERDMSDYTFTTDDLDILGWTGAHWTDIAE